MPDINWLAVVLATVAAFVVGFVWFGPKTFFPVWWRAMGKSPEDMAGGGNMKVLFGSTIIAAFVQAFGVAMQVLPNPGTLGAWIGLWMAIFRHARY